MKLSKWEKLTRKVAYTFLIFTSAIAFLPALSSVYSSYGRYSIYIALLLGVLATIMSFKIALAKSTAYAHIWAIIKLFVLAGAVYSAYLIFAMKYSGI